MVLGLKVLRFLQKVKPISWFNAVLFCKALCKAGLTAVMLADHQDKARLRDLCSYICGQQGHQTECEQP